LGSRARIENVGPLLISILKSDEDYFARYHCASCLLMIFNPFPHLFRPEKLSAREKYYVDQHIEEYEEEMNNKLQKNTG
jgi:HEAT repeat protein